MIRYVKEFSGNDVIYCPNPGNAGDSILAHVTHRLLRRAGLQYHTVQWSEQFSSEGKIILYGGGGNLTDEYSRARHFIERHHQGAHRLAVLPHTVQGHAGLLQNLGANVDIFCRERRSYEWVSRQTQQANVYLADDLAFRLDVETVLDGEMEAIALGGEIGKVLFRALWNRYIGGGFTKKVPPLQAAVEQGGQALQQLVKPSKQHSCLYALREDLEQEGGKSPAGNVDLSQVFAYGTASASVAEQATRAMLSYLNRFERIKTNRLHICIPAALLGKQVDFYANSYFKNEAIYEHSIAGSYPNVRWSGVWRGGDE